MESRPLCLCSVPYTWLVGLWGACFCFVPFKDNDISQQKSEFLRGYKMDSRLPYLSLSSLRSVPRATIGVLPFCGNHKGPIPLRDWSELCPPQNG
jgi:hypothetical protein